MSDKQCSCERPMIAALLAGAILMLVVGFVLGWAWDKREGALSDVSILNLLTAFGTVGAVFVALRLDSLRVDRRRGENQLAARLAISSIRATLLYCRVETQRVLVGRNETVEMLLQSSPRRLEFINKFKAIRERMTDKDILTLSVISREAADNVASANAHIITCEGMLSLMQGIENRFPEPNVNAALNNLETAYFHYKKAIGIIEADSAL